MTAEASRVPLLYTPSAVATPVHAEAFSYEHCALQLSWGRPEMQGANNPAEALNL